MSRYNNYTRGTLRRGYPPHLAPPPTRRWYWVGVLIAFIGWAAFGTYIGERLAAG